MTKSIVNLDWYSKFILTLIAFLLFGLLVKPIIVAKKVTANPQRTVYIENTRGDPVPVEVVCPVEISSSDIDPVYIRGRVNTRGY